MPNHIEPSQSRSSSQSLPHDAIDQRRRYFSASNASLHEAIAAVSFHPA